MDTTETRKTKNTNHCKGIALDLEAVCEGRAYYDENGDFIVLDDDVEAPEDYYQVDMLDYLGDGVYDIEYRLNSNRDFKNVALMVACGGPNIWIDAGNCKVELFWWGDYAYWSISPTVCDEINSLFEGIYDC